MRVRRERDMCVCVCSIVTSRRLREHGETIRCAPWGNLYVVGKVLFGELF